MHEIISFLTLSALEIVLGIDNLIFIALVCSNLPVEYRNKARYIGLGLALIMRVVMLFGVTWIMKLTEPVVTIDDTGFSFKDLLMLAGGGFLLAKATLEMHHDIAGEHEQGEIAVKKTFRGAVFQIVLIDLVFSFDSVITAVGLSQNLYIIIGAVVVSMAVMLAASNFITQFLQAHPTFKMLALSFILMIGIVLVADGLHFHIPKGYIYFAMAFSCFIEFLNIVARGKRKKKKSGKAKRA